MSTSSDVYSEEPYALIWHVRFCEGKGRAQNGAYPLYSTRSETQLSHEIGVTLENGLDWLAKIFDWKALQEQKTG